MKYLVGANFKMNKTMKELQEYIDFFIEKYSCFLGVDVFIAPVTVALCEVSEIINESCINLGAQNMHYDHFGAYTGEVSPDMLQEINCKYVIIGHSERRELFNETNEIINKKVIAAIEHSIKPILCIGETLKQKELGLSKEILKIQLIEGLDGVEDWNKVDIAYEPVWAIGTGLSATPKYIGEIHSFIRSVIGDNESRIIYGGSVKEENAEKIIKVPNVNGFLIGSASLDP
ncbi:MAG: triose-phosphate isomerase [Candidatus Gracilibacteria bacterium]|nr:triose-phosphate isomerase [Candidatus Gracilibacteria bacterium]